MNTLRGNFVLFCCTALLAGGCAQKTVMTGDGSALPSSLSTASAPSALADTSSSGIGNSGLQEQPVREASVKAETVDALKSTAPEVTLEKILFDFDSSALSPAARETLARNHAWMSKNPAAKVQIEGHCDERGADEYNLALGEKRAKSAMEYLVTLGVQAKNLSIISYGKEKPADPGHSEEAWAKNRRAEFVVTGR